MKAASRRGIAGRVKSPVRRQALTIKEKGGLPAAFQRFYAVRRRVVSPASPRTASSRPIGQIGVPPPVVARVGVAGVAVGAAVGVGVAVTAAVPVNLRFISTAVPVSSCTMSMDVTVLPTTPPLPLPSPAASSFKSTWSPVLLAAQPKKWILPSVVTTLSRGAPAPQ